MLRQIVDIVITVAKEYGIYVGLVSGLSFLGWMKRNLIKKFFGGKDEKTLDIAIESALYSIMWKLKADRVSLYEYSEYDKRIFPIPFRCATNTVEVTNPSVSVKKQKQTLSLSAIPLWTKKLSEEGEVHIYDVEDLRQEDTSTYEILHSKQIKSCHAISIVDFRGVPLGFVGIDYCQINVEISQQYSNILKCEALKIAGFLIIKRNGSLNC